MNFLSDKEIGKFYECFFSTRKTSDPTDQYVYKGSRGFSSFFRGRCVTWQGNDATAIHEVTIASIDGYGKAVCVAWQTAATHLWHKSRGHTRRKCLTRAKRAKVENWRVTSLVPPDVEMLHIADQTSWNSYPPKVSQTCRFALIFVIVLFKLSATNFSFFFFLSMNVFF